MPSFFLLSFDVPTSNLFDGSPPRFAWLLRQVMSHSSWTGDVQGQRDLGVYPDRDLQSDLVRKGKWSGKRMGGSHKFKSIAFFLQTVW